MERTLVFPGGRMKAVLIGYDDGLEQDERLLEILDRRRLKGTFFLSAGCFLPEGMHYAPGEIHRRLTLERAVALYADREHEIACHGLFHEDFSLLDGAQAAYQLIEDRARLERIFHRIIRGFAYPYGNTSAPTEAMLAASGFAYARTVQLTHETIPQTDDFFHFRVTTRHRLPEFLPLADAFLEAPDTRPAVFGIFGHTYELERDQNWLIMERFAERMAVPEKIWSCTYLDYVDYIRAFQALRTSCCGSLVENPSGTPVWFRQHGRVYTVGQGQTIQTEGNEAYQNGERCRV
ncbi:MAG: polysaccharide deacetylase family protein [Clostridia bacterium]|nr:polysaccharide deacetylase family protein [Clostridia bacterium]